MHAVRPTFASAARRARLAALTTLAATAAVFATASPAFAKSRCKPSMRGVLRVGTYEGKRGQCKTIQEAVKAAQSGDWILIGPGDYKQSSTEPIPGAKGDDRSGTDILVTTPN